MPNGRDAHFLQRIEWHLVRLIRPFDRFRKNFFCPHVCRKANPVYLLADGDSWAIGLTIRRRMAGFI
jgi:hypothetical protein